jgi:molybdopterin-containing oxidoreductase family iron-sulfur binding subunit
MKPEPTDNAPAPAAPDVWQSLDEYMDSPAFRAAMEDEFPEDAAEWTDPVTRRRFLTIMGASLALAGAAGCSPRPASQRKIVPYTRQPEELVPGVPLFFATAFTLGGVATGVLVRSHEGRPVKVEGNPDHPSSRGGVDVFAQASLLDLYDPDRSKEITKGGIPDTYENAITALRGQLEKARQTGGVSLRILTDTVSSPTFAAAIDSLLKAADKKGGPGGDLAQAKWVQWDPCNRDNAHEGARRAFGSPVNVTYDFTKADVVLALDADFLTELPGHVRYCRDFASRRKVRGTIPKGEEANYIPVERLNRLYAVEPMQTTTGGCADHRLALRASEIEGFARNLAQALGVSAAPAGGALKPEAAAWVQPLAKDLTAHKGKCVVVAGDHQPASVHALVHAINEHLGNHGRTVLVSAPVEARPSNQLADLKQLVEDMNAGKVETLIVCGTNPAYTAPNDVKFAEALKKVPVSFHHGGYQDETAVLCTWHVPSSHYLEAWGDCRGHDGTATLQQPLIAPMNSGRSAVELFADATNAPYREGRDILRDYWRGQFGKAGGSGEFEVFWQESVRRGVIDNAVGNIGREAKAAFNAGKWAEGPAAPVTPGEIEINFRPDPALYDGRFANNSWLQELPKPVTKMTWDNAALVSPGFAKKYALDREYRWTAGERGRVQVSVIELKYKGASIRLPAWIVPGHADDSVTVYLGHGRERAGRVAHTPGEPNAEKKPVRGSNAYRLQTSAAPGFDGGLDVSRTNDTYYLACLQAQGLTHGTKDPISGEPIERNPARRMSLAEYHDAPARPKIPPASPGETALIDANVPGSKRTDPHVIGGTTLDPVTRRGIGPGGGQHADHGHEHGDHDHGDHEHDKRLIPLTMVQPNQNLYPVPDPNKGRKWAMAIDLSACTGCNSCVIACQSENNIPVVGKYEVTRGHEMHWIRVDRYYTGDLDRPDIHFQPVPCQQCEKAPCEIVCPVGATVHSADGLNDMVYNRCVGTRYCSNNCPYKVRRFNFLTYQDWYTESIKLGRNPDVTVRSRGVMEKCTYCVQRIRYAEVVAEREGREIRDGEIVTACQSACPSGAIMFGNLGDANSMVAKWKAEPTNYGLLAEQNTMPRTSYLGGVRNPNPDMPGAAAGAKPAAAKH